MTKRGLSSYLPCSLALHAALFLSAILIMLLSRGNHLHALHRLPRRQPDRLLPPRRQRPQ
ncbi:MAG: hypothetical protein MZV64_71340 [Ignavibacteriales bacterium]|nr:hypothetical protein [Ignavibacteriales bacterium]